METNSKKRGVCWPWVPQWVLIPITPFSLSLAGLAVAWIRTFSSTRSVPARQVSQAALLAAHRTSAAFPRLPATSPQVLSEVWQFPISYVGQERQDLYTRITPKTAQVYLVLSELNTLTRSWKLQIPSVLTTFYSQLLFTASKYLPGFYIYLHLSRIAPNPQNTSMSLLFPFRSPPNQKHTTSPSSSPLPHFQPHSFCSQFQYP